MGVTGRSSTDELTGGLDVWGRVEPRDWVRFDECMIRLEL